jgi:hypothetical protein
MNLQRSLHWVSCFAAAAGLTYGICLLDLQRAGVQRATDALAFARQVSAQVEGFALDAREHGEKDSVGWAARLMNQGVEPRVVQVSKTVGELQSGEAFRPDFAQGILEYGKALNPEEGIGLRVLVRMPRVGFLGTRSVFTGDLAAAATLVALFTILFFASDRALGLGGSGSVRRLAGRWSARARSALTRLGANVREMVRQANLLTGAASRSRMAVEALRGRIHGNLTKMHDARKSLRDCAGLIEKGERDALSAVLEANRLGEAGKPLVGALEELHALLRALSAARIESEGTVLELEKSLEPWATDADVAYHSYDPVFDAAREMGVHIRRTTESVIEQNRLLLELDTGVLAPSSENAAPVAEPQIAVTPAASKPQLQPKPLAVPRAASHVAPHVAPAAASHAAPPAVAKPKRRPRIKTAA